MHYTHYYMYTRNIMTSALSALANTWTGSLHVQVRTVSHTQYLVYLSNHRERARNAPHTITQDKERGL